MPYCRNLLHENKFEDFKDYLASSGWRIEKIKNIYECIRATKHNEKTIVLYKRCGTRHATVGWNMGHALKLINKFIRRTNEN